MSPRRRVFRLRPPTLKALGIWHRRIGLTAALFIVFLSVTGVLLNHSDTLGLDRRHAQSEGLLDWYGIDVPAPPIAFAADVDWIGQIGEHVYFNGAPVAGRHAALKGAVAVGDYRLALVGDRLLVLDGSGARIETLGPEHGLPAPAEAIGLAEGRPVLRTDRARLRGDADLARWRPTRADPVWSAAATPPAALRAAMIRHYRGQGLSWERVLLDLHSGRLFGRWGPWLMDLAALAFLVLAATGTWIWSRRRNDRK
ncbi:MAG TPA: PepSY domain-containing protein [Acidiferrobacterales bacterium]